MIVHYEDAGSALEAESVAEVRSNYDGLFMFGGPDIQVVNVTKDRIWSREAAVPEGAAIAPLDPRWLMPQPFPESMDLPRPEMPRETQQEQFLRDMEIDPHEYYPPDVDREIVQNWPDEGFSVDPREMLRSRGIEPDDD